MKVKKTRKFLEIMRIIIILAAENIRNDNRS